MQNSLHIVPSIDIHELASMNRMLLEDEGAENPMSVAQLEERLGGWLESGAYHAAVMHHNEEVVGYILYREEQDAYDVSRKNIYVRQFFIKRTYRRRGIGRAAFEQVVATQFPPGTTIVLEVLASNLQGRAFWERLGFQPYFTTYRRRPADVKE